MEITRTAMGPILGQPRDPSRDPTTEKGEAPTKKEAPTKVKTTCNMWGREKWVAIKPIEGATII